MSASSKRRIAESEMSELDYLIGRVSLDRPEGATFVAIVEDNELPDHGGALTVPEIVDEETLQVQYVPASDQYRGMREAWEWDGNSVVVNPTKAENIQWGRVRKIRNELLVRTDVEMSRLAEVSDTAALAMYTAYRNALRDIPQIETDPYNASFPTKPLV